MVNNKRILILTASYGDGHLQAARTLKHSFERQGIEQVHILDLMEEAHPIINKVSTALYIKSMLISQYGFDYYGWSYYITKDTKFHVGWGRYIHNLGQNKLKEIISQILPNAVVSTFPYGAVPEICAHLGILNFTVVTDFTLHARWVHPKIDKYYVSADELKGQLLLSTVPPDRIQVSGIPIREAFEATNHYEKNPFLKVLDKKRKTILILAGSYGVLGHIDEMINSIKIIGGSQVAVVCGRNQKLEQKLKKKFEHDPFVFIFGFVEDIHQLMGVSSCIIAKAGGLTLSESLALQVPLFIYKPFAGQEKENAVFLSSKGVAFIFHHLEELACQIELFLSKPNDANEIKRKMIQLYKKEAADSIVQDILKHIKQPEIAFI